MMSPYAASRLHVATPLAAQLQSQFVPKAQTGEWRVLAMDLLLNGFGRNGRQVSRPSGSCLLFHGARVNGRYRIYPPFLLL